MSEPKPPSPPVVQIIIPCSYGEPGPRPDPLLKLDPLLDCALRVVAAIRDDLPIEGEWSPPGTGVNGLTREAYCRVFQGTRCLLDLLKKDFLLESIDARYHNHIYGDVISNALMRLYHGAEALRGVLREVPPRIESIPTVSRRAYTLLKVGAERLAESVRAIRDQAKPSIEPAPAATPPAPEPEPFIPNDLQRQILELLNGKALKADALEAKLQVDRKSLYRNGLNELRKRGKVKNNRRVGGYYRPDAPPPQYADELGGN